VRRVSAAVFVSRGASNSDAGWPSAADLKKKSNWAARWNMIQVKQCRKRSPGSRSNIRGRDRLKNDAPPSGPLSRPRPFRPESGVRTLFSPAPRPQAPRPNLGSKPCRQPGSRVVPETDGAAASPGTAGFQPVNPFESTPPCRQEAVAPACCVCVSFACAQIDSNAASSLNFYLIPPYIRNILGTAHNGIHGEPELLRFRHLSHPAGLGV